MAGIFIDVEIAEDARRNPELAKKLAEACPVDIFAATGQGVDVVEENLDECILCGLCVEAAPPGAVRVVKLYDDGSVATNKLDSIAVNKWGGQKTRSVDRNSPSRSFALRGKTATGEATGMAWISVRQL